ncbi:MAG: hypothetical protein ACT7A5_34870, partial [Ferrovibrionaceae bacterium]
NKETRIVPHHIQLTVRNDEELSKLSPSHQTLLGKSQQGRIPGNMPDQLGACLSAAAFRRFNPRVNPCKDESGKAVVPYR